jgi:DNA-binding CsgD family transcriptional regulator
MNLDTKEIARISSVTVRSVQTSRYRLRIKFNIPKEMSLIAFFNA